MSRYVGSTTRTNKLHCSNCGTKIIKDDDVIFELSDGGRFLEVYGERCKCKKQYQIDAYHDSVHPYSSEALGQWDD
jgi:hypothetical protein